MRARGGLRGRSLRIQLGRADERSPAIAYISRPANSPEIGFAIPSQEDDGAGDNCFCARGPARIFRGDQSATRSISWVETGRSQPTSYDGMLDNFLLQRTTLNMAGNHAVMYVLVGCG